jgi:hypothetical protein
MIGARDRLDERPGAVLRKDQLMVIQKIECQTGIERRERWERPAEEHVGVPVMKDLPTFQIHDAEAEAEARKEVVCGKNSLTAEAAHLPDNEAVIPSK